MTDFAEIIDVAPRDGLQNEATLLPTETKVELIRRLVGTGVKRLEATSFVHPKLVPAMADAEAVMAALPDDDASYIGLVLNERGLDRAVRAGCHEANYVVAVTDEFSQRNQGVTTDQGIAAWGQIAAKARAAGVEPSLVVSVSFGCPFEGEVSERDLARVVDRCLEQALPSRLSLADTIGVATPYDVRRRFAAINPSMPDSVQLGTHFHNTRNTGIANAFAAIESGVRSFDASAGGVGGCPFAPNATGNIPTEDLVYMLHRMGFETGIDLDGLAAVAHWLEGLLGDSVVGLYSKAGPFPSQGSQGGQGSQG